MLSVLIYAAETWTFLATLEAFQMKWRRQILLASPISSATSTSWRVLASRTHATRRISIFGHIARFENDVPAHMALRRHVDLSVGRPPGNDVLVNLALIGMDRSSSAGLEIPNIPYWQNRGDMYDRPWCWSDATR